jgi:hypothetical protein
MIMQWVIVIGCKVEFESFEMGCWRRMEKISWIDGVKKEEVLRNVKE